MYIFRNLTYRVKSTVCRRFSIAQRLRSSAEQLEDDSNVIQSDENYNDIRRENAKSLRIAILGLPNAGKSTLVNQLVNYQVCAASKKRHTTRVSSCAMLHSDNTELVFVDTPGLVSEQHVEKHQLEPSFRHDAVVSLSKADVVGILHDVSVVSTREHLNTEIMEILEKIKKEIPTLLLLNKVDKLKSKRLLLALVEKLTSETQWPNFSEIFMLSALTGDGVDDLRNYFLDNAKERDWDYNPDIITDQKPEDMIVRIVRGHMLNSLPIEIPYLLDIKMEYFNISDAGSVVAFVNIECPTERHYKLVLGKLKPKLRRIALATEQSLGRIFHRDVRLKLIIKPRKRLLGQV